MYNRCEVPTEQASRTVCHARGKGFCHGRMWDRRTMAALSLLYALHPRPQTQQEALPPPPGCRLPYRLSPGAPRVVLILPYALVTFVVLRRCNDRCSCQVEICRRRCRLLIIRPERVKWFQTQDMQGLDLADLNSWTLNMLHTPFGRVQSGRRLTHVLHAAQPGFGTSKRGGMTLLLHGSRREW